MSIKESRFRHRFDGLARIGTTPEGGVHRPALSPAHLEARRWFRATAEAAGLDIEVDPAGNHMAHLRCGPEGAPTFFLGSHLDSVRNGGRFDGALGVVAALEVLETVRDLGLTLPVHLAAIDFTDEEGSWISLLGSRAFTGALTEQDLTQPLGGREAFDAALNTAGLSRADVLAARRDPETIAGYLELHIEQGTRLTDAEIDIGVVTGMVGICCFRLRFLGQAAHSGTTAMTARRDALQGAAAFALAVRRTVIDQFPDGVANVGVAQVHQGAFNVVPGEVELTLECRAANADRLDELQRTLRVVAERSADEFNLGLEIERVAYVPPAPMDAGIIEKTEQACRMLGLSSVRLPSLAGHDAQSMVTLAPAGMIFVPSTRGISHSPEEHTPWPDCVNGANVLLLGTLKQIGTL